MSFTNITRQSRPTAVRQRQPTIADIERRLGLLHADMVRLEAGGRVAFPGDPKRLVALTIAKQQVWSAISGFKSIDAEKAALDDGEQ